MLLYLCMVEKMMQQETVIGPKWIVDLKESIRIHDSEKKEKISNL
jgi:hypothetical protein